MSAPPGKKNKSQRVGTDGAYPMNGMVKDIRFYNRALSESEVLDAYNLSASGVDDLITESFPLFIYYKDDDHFVE